MTGLPKRWVEKPWGRDCLPQPFHAPDGRRIGEVWFEPPAQLPSILVKYIFTSEKLSVQVHPSDAQAKVLGESDGGKEECWLVIDAQPGAALGIGLKEPVDTETMRRAALDGSIEMLLDWHAVQPGDFFYIPAGTVHAIGAGVSLIEIQQYSDVTYRLYDYGRPRELHLEKGISVAKGALHDPALRRRNVLSKAGVLVDGQHFSVEYVTGSFAPPDDAPFLVLPLTGVICVGDNHLMTGDCDLVTSAAVATAAEASGFLVIHQR